MIFEDGSREPLHGHNYRVMIKGEAPALKADMVFDFLDIKPIVRDVCNSLDHRLLLPKNNIHLKAYDEEPYWKLVMPDDKMMIIPKEDIIFLPIENTSAERLAIYLCGEIKRIVFEQYKFNFSVLEVEVEETPGQSAVYREVESKS